MRRSIAVTGRADPATVWQRYVEPARWPEWSPQIRSVTYPHATLRPGTSGVAHGWCGLDAQFDVLLVDQETRWWSWSVTAPLGVHMTLGHAVVAAGSGTRTTLQVDGPGLVLPGYLPVAYLALTRLVRP